MDRWALAMSRTESTMLALGTAVPAFSLPDVSTGKVVNSDDFRDKKGLLVMFICRHCPYVKHVQQELARIGRDYAAAPLGIVAISANDAENYPEDSPESLREMAAELGFTFPLCYDKSQDTAKAFTAACTPDFFLFDGAGKLAYRGQLDDSRRSNDIPPSGKDLRAAIDAVLHGQAVNPDQRPSIGCNIKWRS